MKTSTDEKIIIALLECRNLAEVSEKTNMPPRTLYTLMQNPEFKAKLSETKSRMLNQAIIKLNNCTSECVDILAKIARDDKQNGQIRVGTCRALLDTVGRFNEQLDMLDRLEKLERLQAENSRN